MSSLLHQAFNPENFRENAHQLVDLLADYLENSQKQAYSDVIPFKDPQENLEFWEADYANNDGNILNFYKNVVDKSVHLHHPNYIGHQVPPPVPIAALSGMLTGLLNNGMAVYEMGLVSNPLERITSQILAKRIGFDKNSSGLLTSGGTLANLTALLAARAKFTDVWEEGTTEKLAVMVSDEAHYCIDRAARIMGMGSVGIIKVPTNERFQMKTELLEKYHSEATGNGFRVIAIIGSACSTSTGSYDNLEEISLFAQQKNIWFHVDGAHGCAVVFSEKYRHKVKGIEMADSVVIDWHKMLMTPALATAVIFKNDDDSYKTFQQKAQYLWANQHSKDWFNSGKRTFECTKLMMSVKIYSIIKAYGEEIFTENVDYLHDLAKEFANLVEENPNFELALQPESNIVCFRKLSSNNEDLNVLNSKIREKLLADCSFYIVQTTLRNQLYLRVSIMNPLTKIKDLKQLLETIENVSLD